MRFLLCAEMPEIRHFFVSGIANAALIPTFLSRGSRNPFAVKMKSVAATPFLTIREKVYLSWNGLILAHKTPQDMPIFPVSPAVLLLYLPFHNRPFPQLEHDAFVGIDSNSVIYNPSRINCLILTKSSSALWRRERAQSCACRPQSRQVRKFKRDSFCPSGAIISIS